MDEHREKEVICDIGQNEAWAVNIKRLVEDALSISAEVAATGVESIKRNRAIVDKIVSDAQQFDNQRQVIANQSLQNAVETANMVSKQAIRHSDIAIDRQWNVDEQAWVVEAMTEAVLARLVQMGKIINPA
jgi:hypothetical protein